MIPVKVCGLTHPGDAVHAARAGAEALGLVFYARSPRAVDAPGAIAIARAVRALERPPVLVGVFVHPDPGEVRDLVARVGLDLVQLSGDEEPGALEGLAAPVIKALRPARPADLDDLARYERAAAFLIDARHGASYGGTGRAADWDLARAARSRAGGRPVILAGGISPETARAAAASAWPDALDAASGTELSPGVKDPARVEALLAAAAEVEGVSGVFRRLGRRTTDGAS